jgi:hypothetical protein
MDRPTHGGAFPGPDCQAVRRFRLVVPLALYACTPFALAGCAVARAAHDPIISVAGTAHGVEATKAVRAHFARSAHGSRARRRCRWF